MKTKQATRASWLARSALFSPEFCLALLSSGVVTGAVRNCYRASGERSNGLFDSQKSDSSFRKVAAMLDRTNHSAFRLITRPKSAPNTVVHHKVARKAVQFTSHGKHARRDTMPVGTGIKREKVPFQQVLLQLSPFFWQGDASWAWNTKVPFWTGENQSRISKV